MNPIILNNHVTSSVVTKEQINQICPTVLSNMTALQENFILLLLVIVIIVAVECDWSVFERKDD